MESHHLHPSKIWSVTMESVEPRRNVSPSIVVNLSFSHWRELHHHCRDPNSPSLDNDDHNTLSKELVDWTSKGTLVFPLKPETLLFSVAFAEGVVEGEGLPEFVTVGAWSYLKEKVLTYLLENVDFDDDDNQGLGFEMKANLDISTVDVLLDDDRLEDCSDDDEGDYDDDNYRGIERLAEEILDLE